MSFVNLHGHSHYSLLDGFGSPKSIVKRAKELGYPAVALTDHGVIYGLMELYKAAKDQGIKPILGCELYIAPRSRFDKEGKVDSKPYHLTVLAKNNQGYQNLLELVTLGHLEGFYYKPRVDYEMLEKYSEGLIVLSGCMAAHIPRLILAENDKEMHEMIEKYIKIFGKENFFLEIQDNPFMEQQAILTAKIRELGKQYGLGTVLTFDSHYPNPEDKNIHDLLLCIQTQSTVNDENRMRYTGDYCLRDINELKEKYADWPEVIENTLKIADMCNVEMHFGQNLIPSFETPNNEAYDAYLKSLCEQGLKVRFENKEIPENYKERLEYELKTVHSMGFDTYFLIVHDFVKYAKEQGIIVGPGRGSAAGSIIAWSLRITEVDPISNGLFFERFLNPERVSMPDIDIDFADHRRDEVLNYVIQKYGRNNVAQIITFGTMAPKAAIRDAGRALGYPYNEVDALAKSVPPAILGKYAPLNVSIKEDPTLKKVYETEERAKVVLDYARRLEGTVRHVGTHACAVIISEKLLTNYTALQNAGGGGEEIVTQYDAKPLEDLGLLKMDFLGLKNLTVIEKTTKIVKRTKNIDIDIEKIPMDDAHTFQMLQKADTTGVFQLESGGMRRYLKQLKPTQFEDIVAMGALYRPGPMEWIPQYIEGKHHPEKVKYLDESFKSILEPTHGVAVYQEQILQLARDFAGFSLGEADILRKAVGKKDPKLLVEQREKFVEGAINNGHKREFAQEVFEKVIEPFAGYGFNKAHAVCYGLIAYQTAYLKAHHFTEFMTALLCSDAGNTDRVVIEIKECIEMGIDILPPSVNESYTNFTVAGEKKIRFGLLAIKGVGEGPIHEIITERDKNGAFKTLEDFANRVPSQILNKKLIQALAYSGAFDEFGDRNEIAENFSEISKFGKQNEESKNNGQTDIFGLMTSTEGGDHEKLKLKPCAKSTNMQKLKWEKAYIGMYVSGHPLRGLSQYISRKSHLIGKLTKKHISKKINIIGAITELRKILTKSGSYMATFVIEDPSGKLRGVMFPKTFNQYGNDLAEDMVVGLTGKLDDSRGQFQIVCDAGKILSIDTMIENAKENNIYNPDDKSDIAVRFLEDILNTEESENNNDEDSFLIEIPSGIKPEAMQSIKNLLMENRGKTNVELYLLSVDKKIKLPFTVNLSDKLKQDIQAILSK